MWLPFAPYVPARYILPHPYIPYRFLPLTTQAQSKAPSLISVPLLCLHPKSLTNQSLRNPPRATMALPVHRPPIHDLRVPWQNLQYRLPLNPCSTVLTRSVDPLVTGRGSRTLQPPPCLLPNVQGWSRRLVKSRSCSGKHPVRISSHRCNDHFYPPMHETEEATGQRLQFQIRCTLATEASGHLLKELYT